ncbi:hypothetical protein NLU13_0096 [Sarocladium strictum]|uniref:Heterokaryon incompatibility domain-containing protein n=1 Tax=Sarocladium strictum TaxID=5046 RepID=A0AA39GNG5_SARSR|nr:hypothetical protein NLU13_0096 [Sarocladium strictum]
MQATHALIFRAREGEFSVPPDLSGLRLSWAGNIAAELQRHGLSINSTATQGVLARGLLLITSHGSTSLVVIGSLREISVIFFLMALGTLPDYQYSSLVPGSRTFRAIRLLGRLRSWPAFLDRGTLRIEIEEVQVDSGAPYECLSYTWGVADGQVPDRRVVVDTAHGPRQLFIHRPLEAALFQLMSSKNVASLLFVDQISLDQSNDAEKADQVPLMKDIYAHSTRTLVWLGPGTRESDAWFDFVREIHAEGILSRLMGPNRGHFMQVFDAVMDSSIPTAGVIREDVDDLRSLMDRYSRSFPLKALAEVFKRSWFTRLWVIQEICLPPNITMICGTRTLCFDCFRSGNLFFSIYSSYLPNQLHVKVSKAGVVLHWDVLSLSQRFLRIYQERRAIHVSGVRQNALDTVLRYSVVDGAPNVGASKPEDRIYGMMGLMDLNDDLHKIKVRYNDVAGVYTEFAGMQARKDLDILCYSQFPKQNDVPSWVPDWHMQLSMPLGYTKLDERRYAAGTHLSRPPQVDVELGTKTLMVRGIMVDRIIKVSKTELAQDPEPTATDRIDDRSAQLFFGEMDEFLRAANEIPESRFRRYNVDDARRADADIRLADRGLSERYLRDLGMAEADIRTGLRAAKLQTARLGQRLLDVDEKVRSYHMSRIFKTVGIFPWYWEPRGDTDICQAMAVNPVRTSLNWVKGAALFVVDVAGLCLASWVTVGFSHWLRLKKLYYPNAILFSRSESSLRKHGLDASVEHSKAVSTLNDFMLKNKEQRLYVTEHGHVGLGPRTMQPHDVLVVLPGSTVPHVLRRMDWSEEGEQGWCYLGEAYCDGIMDGELLQDGGEAAEARTFRIR